MYVVIILPAALILSLQCEIMTYLYIEHKITGFAKFIGGNREFCTQKLDMGGNWEFSTQNLDMDGLDLARTGWSGVVSKFCPVKGSSLTLPPLQGFQDHSLTLPLLQG